MTKDREKQGQEQKQKLDSRLRGEDESMSYKLILVIVN
jgi:hypothetical protein